MPAISIAQIPNALPQATSASGMNISPPSAPGLMVKPQVALAGNAASASGDSFRGAAKGMLSQTLELGAFSAEANAAMKMGQAVGNIGLAASELSNRFAAAKDTADMARAETTMRAAFEKQQYEQLGLPPEKWQDNLTRNLGETQKALGEIKMSNNAVEKFGPSWDRWSQLSRVQVEGQARGKQLEGWRQDVNTNALMKVTDGDLSGATATIDQAVKSGIFSESEGKAAKAKIYVDEAAKQKDEHFASMIGVVVKSPHEALTVLEKDVKNGSSTFAPGATKVDNLRYLAAARSNANQNDVDTYNWIRDSIVGNRTTTNEEIDAAGKYLGDTERTALKGFLITDPAYDAEKISKIRMDIANLNMQPTDDLSGYHGIGNRILTEVPKNLQDELRGDLKSVYDNQGKPPTPKQAFVGSLATHIDGLATRGVFGKYWTGADTPGGAGAQIDEVKKAEVWTKVETYNTQIRKYLADTPNASSADGMEFFQKIAGPEASVAISKEIEEQRQKPSWYTPLVDWATGAGDPGEDTVKMVKGFEGFTPAAYPDGKQNSGGYGTKAKSLGEVLTEKQADARLRQELSMHTKIIDDAAKVAGMTLTKNQRQALISFDFNTGAGGLVIRRSRGDHTKIPAEMVPYRTQNGIVLRGLEDRRKAEIALFNTL